MACDIPVGNCALLVAFDGNAQLREFYFPYVGRENHAGTADLKNADRNFLYDHKQGRFLRMVNFRENGEIEMDYTVNSSLCGLFSFGVFDARYEMIENTM